MICTNPCLLQVVHIKHRTMFDRKRYESFGFKFNSDNTKMYKFLTNESDRVPLEKIDAWQRQSVIELPCGSCLACRIDYSQDWAVRCQFESKLWKYNYFVTLTYNEKSLPKGLSGNNTLSKDHIRKFIKALRYYFRKEYKHTGIRYILCGEYNSSGERILNPHYHMILFNLPIPDLTIDFPDGEGHIIHKFNSTGMPMFYSRIIDNLWSDEEGNSRGYVSIDDANFNTEAYVSQYILKKQKGESASIYSENLEVEAPFLRMSNRPGIGFNAFLLDKDKYVVDPYIILSRPSRPLVTGIPRYFKRKLFEIDPKLRDDFEVTAKQRELKMRSIRAAYNTTSNMQKFAKRKHLESINTLRSRNFDN